MNQPIPPAGGPDPKILMIKLGAVGDLVMASAFFEGVRQNFPRSRVALLVSNRILHTVKENPHIDQFILADTDAIYKSGWLSRLREVFRLITLLRKQKFDQVFVLHWAWPFNLMAFLCRIPVRVGFGRNREGLLLTHRVRTPKERNNREAYLDLLRAVGKPVRYRKSHYYLSARENRFLDTFVEEHRIGAEEVVIALAPGGGRNIKQTMLTRLWPVENFIELIGRFVMDGSYRIVLIAGPDDGAVIQPILKRYRQCIDTRALSFGEKASILRRCRLLVGNDSAPIHIAMAMGVPTYSLWGPTNPKRYGDPLPSHTRLFKEIECSPCYSDGEFPECNDNRCLKAITVNEVWQVLQAELPRGIPRPAASENSVSVREFPADIISVPRAVPGNPSRPTA
ncbi:MAG: glycosyltransferase family 9 protein [Nitrospinae bacterium]|nr:glycosyltransferase family 9 protein [Nitrospinota bacterium]